MNAPNPRITPKRRFVAAAALAMAFAIPLPAAEPLKDEVVVRKLIEALKDSDPDIRNNLSAALTKLGPAAVEQLGEALKDSLPERRAGAAYALGSMGANAKVALPKLLDALADADLDVRRQVSLAISRIVPHGTTKAEK